MSRIYGERLIMFFIFRSDSKRECIEKFGKQPNARVIHDDDQLCTTEYSRIVPLENGEVKTSYSSCCIVLAIKKQFLWNKYVLSRSWCLWSTVGRGPKTSPTRRCCETSRRPPTSACASCAPAPCWATWSPRPRETPPSHAGWGTYCTTSHIGVMLAHSRSPFGKSLIYSSASPTLQLPFCWHTHTELLPPAHLSIFVKSECQVCQSVLRHGNSCGRDSEDGLGQLPQAAGAAVAIL